MKGAFVSAIAVAAGLVLAGPAFAMPTSPLDGADPHIIKVFGGCGPYGHRGPWGGCRPGGQWGGGYRWRRACPPGWHLGAYGRRCWPNRY